MKMKGISVYVMMLLSLLAVASCSVDGEDDRRVIIEPPELPMFQFGADGIPYRYGMPNLPKEMQETFRKEAVGYGWKWMQTNEIMEDGWVNITPYYDGMYGVSPSSYYIESANRLVKYFHSDAVNADAFWRSGCEMDVKTGILTNGATLNGIITIWDIYFRVWGMHELSGKWYMSCIEPLCTRSTDDGRQKVVWGMSQYVRMTAAELREMQKKHTFDYTQVN